MPFGVIDNKPAFPQQPATGMASLPGQGNVQNFKFIHSAPEPTPTGPQPLVDLRPPQAQQGPQMDPFFQLALQFLYPNGIPGQQEPQRGMAQQPQVQPQADPLQQLLGGLGGIDPLLQQLLGGFNPQPQPAPPYFNQGLGKF